MSDPYVFESEVDERAMEKTFLALKKTDPSLTMSPDIYRDANGRLRRKSDPSKPSAAPAPAPACRRVSDLSVAEHEELLRKNSFWGALGDSLDSAFEFLIRVAAVLIGLAVLGVVAMWLIAHFSGH